MTTRRDWSAAEFKRADGCRVGYFNGYDECFGPIELAHLAPRIYDDMSPTGVRIVRPANVVALCQKHHEAFDAHRLSLLEFLTYEEQGHVAARLGLVRALKRVGGEQCARRRQRCEGCDKPGAKIRGSEPDGPADYWLCQDCVAADQEDTDER